MDRLNAASHLPTSQIIKSGPSTLCSATLSVFKTSSRFQSPVAIVHDTWTIFCINPCFREHSAGWPHPILVQNPENVILRLFQDILWPKGSQSASPTSCVSYIHLRVSRAVIDNCVSRGKAQDPLPDLRQTIPLIYNVWKNSSTCHGILSDVNLSSHGPYNQDFLEPSHATAAAYVYFPVHGAAALGKGGRPAKRGGRGVPPNNSAVNYFSASLCKFQLLHWPA